MHLIPAYGRDYKSIKEVKHDWEADKDFLIQDISSPHNGRYVNKQSLPEKTTVYIKYQRLTKVAVLKS